MHSLHRSIRGPDRGEMLLHLGIWSAPRLVVCVGPLRIDFRPLSDGRFPAISGLSRSPRKFPMSGRSRQQAEVAPAVDAWRRYQRGEARKDACEHAYYAFSGPAAPSRTADWIDSSRRFQYAAHLWLG